MSRFACFATEELEVDKVYRQQQETNAGDEFDELYQNVRQDLNAKREQQEDSSKEESSEPSDTSSEEELPEDTDISDDGAEPDATESLESFLTIHREAVGEYFAQEDIFTKENVLTAGKAIGSASYDGMVWLKNIGFEYGPVLLKHVYKGILFALDKTLRAIFKGSVSITKYIRKRMNSYTVFKEKIQKAREALNLIEGSGNEEAAFFTDEVSIQQLLISNHTDITENLGSALMFFKGFVNSFETKVSNHVAGIGRLIDNVIKTNGKFAGQYSPDVIIPNNFKKAILQGYHPEHEEVESYVYERVLPGNISAIGFFPRKNLNGRDEIITALSESKMFFGVNMTSVVNERSIAFKTKADLLKLLDVLDAVCDVGLASEKTYIDVARKRNGIKGYLSKYTRFLYNLKEKMSIYESMADIISLELQYMDSTYIASSLQLHDYMARVLNASLTYVKQNIKTLS